MMKSKLLHLCVMLGCLGFASRASAGTIDGFVCQVTYDPSAGTLGSYGYIYLSIYSQPGCQGSWRGGGYLCSSGATSGSCAPTHLYREHALYHLFGGLQRAASDAQHVIISTDSQLRLMYANFRSN